jgi:hypothetical protein
MYQKKYVLFIDVFCCPKGIVEPSNLAKDNGYTPEEHHSAPGVHPGKLSLSSCP